MVQAQELRIGNIIQSPPMNIPRLKISSNGYMTVTGYGISVLESDTSNKLGWTSIPLSEEILLKVGFESIYKSDFTVKLELTSIPAFEAIRMNNSNWIIIYKSEHLTHIKHLHQLQNLIFSFSGQELNTSGLI